MNVKKPEFGVRLPCAGVLANPQAMARVAQEAESLGFDTVWVHDYIIWNKTLDRLHISCGSREAVDAAGDDYPPMFFESLTNLAFIAGLTSTVRLGVAVLCLPYRPPLQTARQLANIDVLSNGRLDLGIGQGAAKSTLNEDFEVLGIPRGEKVGRTREIFEAMRKIWTEDAPSFEGKYINFPSATIYPKPVQKPHPRVWMGGSAEKSLDMIADYADVWLSFWISPEQFPKAIEVVHDRLRSRGRDPEKFTVGTEIQVLIAKTTPEARHQAERTLGVLEEGYAGTIGRFAEEGGPATATMDPSQEIWNSSLIGSVGDVGDQVHGYVNAGCTAFEMKFIYHNIDHLVEQMSAFSAGVIKEHK
jgi:probable F420-dependent oxidoreductase